MYRITLSLSGKRKSCLPSHTLLVWCSSDKDLSPNVRHTTSVHVDSAVCKILWNFIEHSFFKLIKIELQTKYFLPFHWKIIISFKRMKPYPECQCEKIFIFLISGILQTIQLGLRVKYSKMTDYKKWDIDSKTLEKYQQKRTSWCSKLERIILFLTQNTWCPCLVSPITTFSIAVEIPGNKPANLLPSCHAIWPAPLYRKPRQVYWLLRFYISHGKINFYFS